MFNDVKSSNESAGNPLWSLIELCGRSNDDAAMATSLQSSLLIAKKSNSSSAISLRYGGEGTSIALMQVTPSLCLSTLKFDGIKKWFLCTEFNQQPSIDGAPSVLYRSPWSDRYQALTSTIEDGETFHTEPNSGKFFATARAIELSLNELLQSDVVDSFYTAAHPHADAQCSVGSAFVSDVTLEAKRRRTELLLHQAQTAVFDINVVIFSRDPQDESSFHSTETNNCKRSLFDDPDCENNDTQPTTTAREGPASWRSVHNITVQLTDTVGSSGAIEDSVRATFGHEATICYNFHQRNGGATSHSSSVLMREQMHHDSTTLRVEGQRESGGDRSNDRRSTTEYAVLLSKEIVRRVTEADSLLAQRCVDACYPFLLQRARPSHCSTAVSRASQEVHNKVLQQYEVTNTHS